MKTRVGVFFGGRSTEHEISVISANQAINALDPERYQPVPVYISKQGKWYTGDALLDLKNYRDLNAIGQKAVEVYMETTYGDFNLYRKKASLLGGPKVEATLDVAIPVLHGANGEDGTFQGVLDIVGLPYAGCDVLASANGMDKITMKMILAACDIPVVPYVWFTDRQWFADSSALAAKVEERLGYPVIVKPANLGSSVGIGRAADRTELTRRVDEARRYSSRIIVEHMVDNLQEINCSVLGDADDYVTSVCEEPVKSGEILSYQDKYMGGSKGSKGMQSAQKRIPAQIPASMSDRIRYLAGETFRVLSCLGVSRVDVIVDRDDNSIYVNEINTIPGSLSFYLWEATGISFQELMHRLVALALKRRRDQEQKTLSFDQNIFSLTSGAKGGIKK